MREEENQEQIALQYHTSPEVAVLHKLTEKSPTGTLGAKKKKKSPAAAPGWAGLGSNADLGRDRGRCVRT